MEKRLNLEQRTNGVRFKRQATLMKKSVPGERGKKDRITRRSTLKPGKYVMRPLAAETRHDPSCESL